MATIFIYHGWKPIAEWDESVPEYFRAWNVYGPGADEILLRHSAKYGYTRYHSDPHGNVKFLFDNDGQLVEKYTYDVFGRPKITDAYGNPRDLTWWDNRFLFQGREYIGEAGVYDYRHRDYHPRLGRFMQVDPIGFKGDSLNLYRYCGSNPVNRVDPTGLAAGLVTVDEHNNVNIDLPMVYSSPVFYPPLPAGTGQTLNDGINKTVNGDYGKFNVKTNAYESWSGNYITYRSGRGPSKTETGGNRGIWYGEMFPGLTPGYIAAHEAMHLLGLRDLYIGAPGLFKPGPDRKPQPQQGVSPNNLMVGRGGIELTQEQIQEVVDLNAKPRTAEARLMKSVVEAIRSSGLPPGNPGAYYGGTIYASASQAAGMLSWDRMYGTFGSFANRTPGL